MALVTDILIKQWEWRPVGTKVQLDAKLHKTLVEQGFFADPEEPAQLEAKKKPKKIADAEKSE